MRALALPRLMLIADGFASGRVNQTGEELQQQVHELVETGLTFVQLRDHEAHAEPFKEAARHLVERLRSIQPNLTITINTRAAIARELGCGLHVGKRTTEAFSLFSHGGERAGEGVVSPQARPLGYSAHSLREIQHASSAGFDYATFSPIFPTTTHPDIYPAGLKALSKTCAATPGLPVFAVGGITPERTEACLGAGAHGVAVLSDLLDAADPVERIELYREAGVL